MSKRNYIFLFLSACAIGIGYSFLGLFAVTLLLFIGLATIAFLVILLFDILGKTSHWKNALRLLLFGYLAVVICIISSGIIDSSKELNAKSIVADLYKFKN